MTTSLKVGVILETSVQSFLDVLQNRCSYKFCNIHRRTPVLQSLFNVVAGLKVFSCEYCEIFKNTVSYRTRPITAS